MSEKQFDYNVLKTQVVAPDEQVTLSGSEFMFLVQSLRDLVLSETLTTRGFDGKEAGFILTHAGEISQQIFEVVQYNWFKRFYEEGKTISYEEYKKQQQVLEAESQVKEEPTLSVVKED